MLGDEYPVPVLGGKHVPRVEPHPQARHVGPHAQCRFHKVLTAALGAVLGIGDRPTVAVRIAEVEAGLGRPVELVGRDILTQVVPPVVGKPQHAALRVPVETDAVTDAVGEDLEVRSVGPNPEDAGVALVSRQADVARGAHLEVQPSVGAEAKELPPVIRFGRKAVQDHDRVGGIVEPGFDPIVPEDAAHLRYVQRTVTERHPVRHGQPGRDRMNHLGGAVTIAVDHGVHPARALCAHEHCAVGAQRQRTGALGLAEFGDVESRGQPQTAGIDAIHAEPQIQCDRAEEGNPEHDSETSAHGEGTLHEAPRMTCCGAP